MPISESLAAPDVHLYNFFLLDDRLAVVADAEDFVRHCLLDRIIHLFVLVLLLRDQFEDALIIFSIYDR